MREHRSASVHVHNPLFEIRNINGGTGTIEVRTFAGLAISKIPQKKDEYNESDEIDDFFNSSSEKKSSNLFLQEIDNSTKKPRKLSNGQGISNKADNEKDEAEAQDSTFISEEDDDSFTSEDYGDPDYIQSDIEGQNPQSLLISSQLENFLESYKKMNVAHKWVLSSGKCVEDTFFKHCERLPVESLLHSWNGMKSSMQSKLPEVDRAFANSMMRFSDRYCYKDLMTYIPFTTSLTYYEDPNEILQKQHLKACLSDMIGMETKRIIKCSGSYKEKQKESMYASQKARM
ncbi:12558_t:CDS:2 [Funneliformis caledonium]|uniref:12558_t:CDS:1 n=1 Tax=Funneliformis caledonium TaxID=1117310 RepID=A0A9N9HW64_9GLOM|nr:12558_t:CDS:2 [Funneliformis caledonium]